MTADCMTLTVQYARRAASRAAETASDAAELAGAGQLGEARRTADEAIRHLERMKRLLQEAAAESPSEDDSHHA
jgi:hypothetical protein